MSSILFASSTAQSENPKAASHPNSYVGYGSLAFFAVLVGGVTFGVSKSISQDLVPTVAIEEDVPLMKMSELLPKIKEEKTPEGPYELVVDKGDTISKILTQSQCSKEELGLVLDAIKHSKKNIILKPGHKVTLDFDAVEDQNSDELLQRLKSVTIQQDKLNKIVITRTDAKFTLQHFVAPLVKKLSVHEVIVRGSFSQALKSVGASASNIKEITAAYSHGIDFQRQLRNGDRVNVVMEKFYTEGGDYVHSGRILYANLNSLLAMVCTLRGFTCCPLTLTS